ncbi:MAG: flagellar protein FliT [Porticoccaceae bacterium]
MNDSGRVDGVGLAPSTAREAALAAVIGLARAMLNAALEGDWEEVARIEATRREEIATCFARTDAHGNAEVIAERIKTLMAIDHQIMRLATTGMDDLRDQLGALRTGRIARQAYEGTGSG